MPPRLRVSRQILSPWQYESPQQARAAVAASGTLTANSTRSMAAEASPKSPSPDASQPPLSSAYLSTQPPSHRSPEFRKSQLLRQYTSTLRSMPLIILFQHHNLRPIEWMGIRRELTMALRKVDETQAAEGRNDSGPLADAIKLQVVQTTIFEVAMRVVDYFRPEQHQHQQLDTTTPITAPDDPRLTHDISRTAHQAVLDKRGQHEFSTLLTGPIAMVTFPSVSPEHVKAALSILAPKKPDFPPPRRKTNPGYYELSTQAGLMKLMLLGARVEKKLFDDEQTRWVGGIAGGIHGLRAQLVSTLQGAGASITTALEGASKSLYLTLESRRSDMEEGEKGDKGEGEQGKSES